MTQQTAAESLQGLTLPCGWLITKYIPKEASQTGGSFSIGYKAEKDGEKAFVKALDLTKLITARGFNDHLKALDVMISSFKFERDILQSCREAKLTKVIKSLSDGAIEIDSVSVPYLVFELAAGDIRKHSISQAGFDLVWSLRTAHQICIGVKQLHSCEISHQDLKPSNILIVDNGDRKIGDFGTSVTRTCELEHAQYDIAGDQTYAPPEGLYGFTHPEWATRRYGNDAYQVGGILVFMIVGIPISTLLTHYLNNDHKHSNWRGSYDEVLPYLEEAFVRVINNVGDHIPEKFREELIPIIKELCNPSIYTRGDPILYRRKQNPFGMERYISRLNTLLTKVEYELG